MKKTLIAGLILGLVAGSLYAPASAGKKKKKKPPAVVAPVPTDVNYYLHRSSCGEATDETTLSTTDDVDGGDDCGALESGLITEIYAQTGQDPDLPDNPAGDTGPDTTTFTATDGVPFVLDATKEIRGSISYSPFVGAGAAGQGKLHAVVTGTTAAASKTIGETTVEFLLTPDRGTYAVEFSIKPDVALDKASFTTLELTVTNRGVSYLHSFYSYDDPSSWITVGTLK